MIGKIIEKITGNVVSRDDSTRPIKVIQDGINSWRIVYAD